MTSDSSRGGTAGANTALPVAGMSGGTGGVASPPPMTGPVAPMTPPMVPDPRPPVADAATPTDVPDAAVGDAAALPDASAEPPVMPEPGAPFSPCTQNADCDTGLACTATLPWLAGTGSTGYCTAFCGATGVATAPCPQPSSGLVKAVCQFSSLCELESCERLQCPEGMQCQHTEQPIGGGQVVDVYRCQP